MNEHTLLIRVTGYVDDPDTETLEMTMEHVRDVLTGQELDVAVLEAVTRKLPDDPDGSAPPDGEPCRSCGHPEAVHDEAHKYVCLSYVGPETTEPVNPDNCECGPEGTMYCVLHGNAFVTVPDAGHGCIPGTDSWENRWGPGEPSLAEADEADALGYEWTPGRWVRKSDGDVEPDHVSPARWEADRLREAIAATIAFGYDSEFGADDPDDPSLSRRAVLKSIEEGIWIALRTYGVPSTPSAETTAPHDPAHGELWTGPDGVQRVWAGKAMGWRPPLGRDRWGREGT